jgi:diguanylate cyclase (GGDEF)-like protein/PAS domain S-box-containing protein
MIVLVPFDQAGKYVSPAVEKITGFTAEEYLGFAGLEMVHPEDRPAVQGLRALLEQRDCSHTIRYRTIRKAGGHCWVEAIVSAYLDPVSREVAGYVSTIRDISEQKDREDVLTAEKREWESMASLDELTGIANRRTFNRALEREARRQTRTDRDLSLLLLDVDYFKKFNDLYGHVAGDSCLRAVAEAIRKCTRRDADLTARYGGEEFVVLMPMTTGAGAKIIAQKVIRAVTSLSLPHAGSPYGIVTVSVGVACSTPESGTTTATLVHQADLALYRAKDSGRNRYQVQEGI